MKDVFGKFGTIVNVKLIKEKDSKDGNLKGFGFIEFEDEDPVDKCNCKLVLLDLRLVQCFFFDSISAVYRVHHYGNFQLADFCKLMFMPLVK